MCVLFKTRSSPPRAIRAGACLIGDDLLEVCHSTTQILLFFDMAFCHYAAKLDNNPHILQIFSEEF